MTRDLKGDQHRNKKNNFNVLYSVGFGFYCFMLYSILCWFNDLGDYFVNKKPCAYSLFKKREILTDLPPLARDVTYDSRSQSADILSGS